MHSVTVFAQQKHVPEVGSTFVFLDGREVNLKARFADYTELLKQIVIEASVFPEPVSDELVA